MSISIIGTGRVAAVLTDALVRAGHDIVAISGRNEEKCEALARSCGAAPIKFGSPLPPSDFVILAISDHAIATVAQLLPVSDAIILHTSGSTDIQLLADHERFGVLWPVQSIVSPPVDLSEVPLVIEANQTEVLEQLRQLATSMSQKVVEAGLDQRRTMHLAAVFVSNFPVHLVHEASRLLKESGISPELMLPLWEGMANRVMDQGVDADLTGPARRGDADTIESHLSMLEKDPELHDMYRILTKSILDKYHDNG